ncbi:hypothetical protein HOLleu_01408 [Holothuria leucospilota]|uniref:Helix-turn-helix domain-containing protein n=1 Tax=Holothuria leucospilota TaxID=206669 RepID=A0A9Q1CQZ0_HOLLE|nr:hypothetical protein HOLleu_01408 [Holothuria leucospilota]
MFNLAEKHEVSDRINVMKPTDAFVTLKDHKPNFTNRPTCRLINPAKSELGKVSKSILDRVNEKVRHATNLNQWRSTSDVVEWFSKIQQKERATFMLFDIAEFYPSISEDLLKQSLDWSRQYCEISQLEYNTIMHCRKSLLFHNNRPWVKKDNPSTFDVTMGSFDGAEICENVGLFILHTLRKTVTSSDIGLYRDDGLAVLKNMTGRTADNLRKKVISAFNALGLKITAESNLKVVNFLDVTFDLRSSSHYPYRKPNDDPVYVHKSSNHPPQILKQIPTAISKRISQLSHNEESFNTASHIYNNALRVSGYNETLTYTTPEKKRKRKRTRKFIWFNPPFCKSVKTNVAKAFLRLIDKHFPPTNPLHKIFNRNTIKVSYSCLPNVRNLIQSHNRKVLRQARDQPETQLCNCRIRNDCPVQGLCLTSRVVYQADISSASSDVVSYIGMTGGSFKNRYANHKKSFRNSKYEKETELSKYIGQLKRQGTPYSIKWSIISTPPPGPATPSHRSLCLEEKFRIMSFTTNRLLNKRSEYLNTCRHSTQTYRRRSTNLNEPTTSSPDPSNQGKQELNIPGSLRQ